MTLYEILEKIELGFDEETGEIFNDEQLDELCQTRDQKIDILASIYKDRLGDIKKFDENIKILEARKKTCQREADGVKRYLDNVLHGEKFKSPQTSISYRSSTAVNIIDADKIPKKYMRVKTEIDKELITLALKGGTKVKGAELVTRNNIQIK